MGGQFYDLGQSSVETILVPQAKEASKGKKKLSYKVDVERKPTCRVSYDDDYEHLDHLKNEGNGSLSLTCLYISRPSLTVCSAPLIFVLT